MGSWVWKVMLGLVAVAAVLTVLPSDVSDADPADGQDVLVHGDFLYTISTEETGTICSIESYIGKDAVVHIPSEIDGYPVAVIGQYCFDGQGDITEVFLPDSVRVIGKNAFFYCDRMEAVHIQEGLEYIGDMAFYGCESLRSITLPSTVYGWGPYAFFQSNSLESVYVNCRELQFDSRLDIGEATVFVNSGIVLNDTLVVSNFAYKVELDSEIMGDVVDDYLEFSIKTVDKSLLDKKLKKAVGFADCYNLTMRGLPEGYQYEVKFGDHYDYHEGMVDYTVYVIDGGRLIDIGMFGPVESPSFHANATETMFCYSVSGGTIPYSPVLGILIACIGTLLAYVYVRMHRGD